VQQALLTNFIGYQAGYNATSAYNSNFFGYQAGNSATNVFGSNLELILGMGRRMLIIQISWVKMLVRSDRC
jgi:hypothetical protein